MSGLRKVRAEKCNVTQKLVHKSVGKYIFTAGHAWHQRPPCQSRRPHRPDPGSAPENTFLRP